MMIQDHILNISLHEHNGFQLDYNKILYARTVNIRITVTDYMLSVRKEVLGVDKTFLFIECGYKVSVAKFLELLSSKKKKVFNERFGRIVGYFQQQHKKELIKSINVAFSNKKTYGNTKSLGIIPKVNKRWNEYKMDSLFGEDFYGKIIQIRTEVVDEIIKNISNKKKKSSESSSGSKGTKSKNSSLKKNRKSKSGSDESIRGLDDD